MFYLIKQESVSALDNITVIDNSLVNVDVETPLPPDIPADVDTAGTGTTRNNGSRFSFMEKRREARRLKKLEVTSIIFYHIFKDPGIIMLLPCDIILGIGLL